MELSTHIVTFDTTEASFLKLRNYMIPYNTDITVIVLLVRIEKILNVK